MKEFAEALRNFLLGLARLLRRWVYQRLPSIALFAAIAALCFVAYREYRENRTARIDFFGSTRGSLAMGQAEKIAINLNETKTRLGLGREYAVTPIYTDGFLDNYRRIASDRVGRAVGFSVDGMGDATTDGVSLLLPLETNYLHFICRNDYLDSCWRLNSIVRSSLDASSEIATGTLPSLLRKAAPGASGGQTSSEELACVLSSRRPRNQPYKLTEIVLATKSAERLIETVRFRRMMLEGQVKDRAQGSDDPPKVEPATTRTMGGSLFPTRLVGATQLLNSATQAAAQRYALVAQPQTDKSEPNPTDTTPLTSTQAELEKLDEFESNLLRIHEARFYYGPIYSASRAFSEGVWKHVQIEPESYESTGVNGFAEMRIAIRDELIQGGFIVAKLNSATVGAVAKDGLSSLVSVDTAEGIQASGAVLQKGDIPAHTYHRANASFCPKPVQTLTTRRVLIASSRLPEEDGYKIARAAAAELGIEPGSIDPKEATSPAQEDHPIYHMHPGASQLIKGETSTTWLLLRHPLMQTLVPAVLLGLLADFLASLTRRLSNAPTSTPKTKPRKRQA